MVTMSLSLSPALSDADVESLERATLDAVAPPVVEAVEGWLIPMERSTVGRAKSAVPLRHHSLDTGLLKEIEARYAAHNLPAAFRVADVNGLAPVHQTLLAMGYEARQPTLVQTGSVRRLREVFPDLPTQVDTQPSAAWADACIAPGFDPVDAAHRVQALRRSRDAAYAWIEEEGQPLAAGTAAFSQGWASLHGIRTTQQARGRGLAGRILAGLAQAALDRGLERVFLQVEEGNTKAIALYQRCGFTTAWRYHYWRKP
jgi:predicted GNAT family acetyltransferase